MFTQVEAVRFLACRVAVYNAELLKNMQPPVIHYPTASKILATETATRVASQAIQIFGGVGLSKEYIIEKIYRDALRVCNLEVRLPQCTSGHFGNKSAKHNNHCWFYRYFYLVVDMARVKYV